jgi:hypothetical protein
VATLASKVLEPALRPTPSTDRNMKWEIELESPNICRMGSGTRTGPIYDTFFAMLPTVETITTPVNNILKNR